MFLRTKSVAFKALAVLCVVFLNINTLALAHIDSAVLLDGAIDIHGKQQNEGDRQSDHESHQCQLSKTFNLRDTGEQFFPPARNAKLDSRDPDIGFGQLSSPPLRPPKS